MIKYGYQFKDIGRALPWSALKSFLEHQTPDSAIFKELYPDIAGWASTAKTNAILADIYDLLNQINANVVAWAMRKEAKKIKPYMRPGQNGSRNDEKHFGSGALPPEELNNWFEEKRGEHNG